jgi:hypothetical protein
VYPSVGTTEKEASMTRASFVMRFAAIAILSLGGVALSGCHAEAEVDPDGRVNAPIALPR